MVDRTVSLGVADGGSCAALNWVNFVWLASTFRAWAAAVSKVRPGLPEAGVALRADGVSWTPMPLLELEVKVWPAPEL